MATVITQGMQGYVCSTLSIGTITNSIVKVESIIWTPATTASTITITDANSNVVYGGNNLGGEAGQSVIDYLGSSVRFNGLKISAVLSSADSITFTVL